MSHPQLARCAPDRITNYADRDFFPYLLSHLFHPQEGNFAPPDRKEPQMDSGGDNFDIGCGTL